MRVLALFGEVRASVEIVVSKGVMDRLSVKVLGLVRVTFHRSSWTRCFLVIPVMNTCI